MGQQSPVNARGFCAPHDRSKRKRQVLVRKITCDEETVRETGFGVQRKIGNSRTACDREAGERPYLPDTQRLQGITSVIQAMFSGSGGCTVTFCSGTTSKSAFRDEKSAAANQCCANAAAQSEFGGAR